MKILVPIANRTNYSKLRGILLSLNKKGDVDLCVVLSSGIVIPKTGKGDVDVYADNIPVISSIDCLLANDTLESMCKTAGISMIEHSSLLAREEPDAVLVVGDRFDMMPVVLSARMMNIPIFHIQGGEESDSIDDTIRKMISVCSDVHYVCTDKAKQKVHRLTESSDVYNFGCSAVDLMMQVKIDSELITGSFHKKFKDGFLLTPYEEYFLVIVHPVTTHKNDIDMFILLKTVLGFGKKCIVVYPNIDAFNSDIVSSIREYHEQVICVKHCPFEDFVQLMAHSACVIGNSSAGIRETASLKVPCVNVGIRQNNRERNTNTIDCVCTEESIKKSITQSFDMELTGENIYYKPNASENIANHMLEVLREG